VGLKKITGGGGGGGGLKSKKGDWGGIHQGGEGTLGPENYPC